MVMHKQFLIICFLLTGITGFSQENLFTISHALETAYKNNIELNQLRAQLKQKKSLWQNVGISQPEISYFMEGIGAELSCPYSERRITISQEIEFPLTVVYRVKGLKQQVEAQKYLIKAREKEIKVDIKSKYIKVLYAQYYQESKNNQQKSLKYLYHAICCKYKADRENNFEMINVSIQLNEANNDFEQSKYLLRTAKSDLFYSMGLSVIQHNYKVIFSDSLSTTHIDFSQIKTLTEQIKHPNHLSFVHKLNASKYSLKEAKSNVFPDIRFSFYKQDYGVGYNYTGFEIGISLPLWQSNEQQGEVKMAMAWNDEIQYQQSEMKLKMSKQIELALQNFSFSCAVIDRYKKSLKLKDQEFSNLSIKAYQLGEINLFNLLHAQQLYFNNQQRYLTALCDYYLQLVILEQYIDTDLVFQYLSIVSTSF